MYFCKKNDFSWIHDVIKRNSRLEVVFCEKGALKNGLKAWNFIKKRLQHKCFPVNFAKFLGTAILKNIYGRQLLHLKYYTPANNTAKVFAKYSKIATARVKKLCCESPRGTFTMFFPLYTGVGPAIGSYYKL